MTTEDKYFDDEDDDRCNDAHSECNFCGGIDDEHDLHCPENYDPFALLLREGYD